MSADRVKGMGLHRSLFLVLTVLFAASWLVGLPAFAGGTPDPGTAPLAEDDELGADGDALPDNENQLIGILGANRGFGFGDYVSDNLDGLQSTLGADAHYNFFIEVPPGQSQLTVEIFDADTGAGDVSGTEEHDQNDNTPWDTFTVYSLLDPDGTVVVVTTLSPQDCNQSMAGLQTTCNNVWSDLGLFTVANPAPGHWQLTVFAIELAGNQDDNNSFGIRAHDGDATAGGNEFNVYADTYVGIGQVYGSSIGPFPGYSRTHDFFPYITGFCSCDANDWDTDADGDEATTYTPPRPPAGTPASFTPTPGSVNGNWGQAVLSGFSNDVDATNYGLWNLRWITGAFNFITFYMGDETAAQPTLPPGVPGSGASPDQQPEPGAIRLYLPADGSRFFGQRGGADDVVLTPPKPWVGQSWALVAGEPDLGVGVTSRIEVTITVANPTAYPIQFSAATVGPNVIDAFVPSNGGQSVYVPGSATITGGSSTATAESGAGPWNLTFAPGVVAAGVTATLTYRIDLTPSGVGVLAVTGAGAVNGTQGSFVDETCADAGGGASVCSASALATATYDVDPLCDLRAPVTGGIGAAKRVISGPTDNLDGTFTVGFELVVENLGTDPLTNVQVTDDLSATFPGPAVVTAVGVVTTNNAGGGMLTANAGYNGVGDVNLLNAAASSLPVGTTSTITFNLTFDPNGLPGPFFNQALAAGDTPGGGTVTDPSDDGADPDPNGNGNANEAGENDPTPIGVPENPSITLTKSAGMVTAAGGGLFDVTYTLVASNTGNVDLTMLQVTDDLSMTFPPAASATAASVLCTAGSCGTITIDFVGPADTTLLNAAASSLVVGASVTLELSVTFDPAGGSGPFTNQATGSAQSPLGTNVQDSDTVDVSITEAPAITLVKTAGAVSDAGGGQFDVTYTLVATNTGNVNLTNLQISDNLSLTFPGPASVTAASALCTAGSCGTVTVDFVGPADTTLLNAAASSLPVATSVTLELSVTFDPGGGTGPFTNQASGSGQSPLGTNVQDSDSADVSIVENPAITVVKTAGPVSDAGGGLFDVTFTLLVTNTGDVDLDMLQVVDDLQASLAPASPTASSVLCTAGSCGTITLQYGGPADTTLLDAANSSLATGASITLELSATVDPLGNAGPFTNATTVSGQSPVGATVQDSDTAQVTPPSPGLPVIGVAKDVVSGPIDNGDSTFTVSISIVVDNLGGVDLFDVQVSDDLSLTFPLPASVISVSAPVANVTVGTGTLTANAAYDGVGDIDLLVAASSTLDFGASGEITFDVTFDPAVGTSFFNTALASADSNDGPTTDTSDDGAVTDTDGDGNPDEVGENDPTPISLLPDPFEIPALGTWGFAALASLLALAGAALLRRRS